MSECTVGTKRPRQEEVGKEEDDGPVASPRIGKHITRDPLFTGMPEKLLESLSNLSRDQLHFVRLVLGQKESIWLTGIGGTGKSHVFRLAYQCVNFREPGTALMTALTGAAACRVNGTTFHSALKLGIGHGDEKRWCSVGYRLRRAKTHDKITRVFIDEVSMANVLLLQAASTVLQTVFRNSKPFGGVQIVSCGDFLQLPPVSGKDSKPVESQMAFEEPLLWRYLCANTVLLKDPWRHHADKAFFEFNEAARVARLSAEQMARLNARVGAKIEGLPPGVEPTALFPYRKAVEEQNSMRLASLSGASFSYRGRVDVVPSDPMDLLNPLPQNDHFPIGDAEWAREEASQRAAWGGNVKHLLPKAYRATMTQKGLKGIFDRIDPVQCLKVGAQVMYLVNNQEAGLVNGSVGSVVGFATVDQWESEKPFPESPNDVAEAAAEHKAGTTTTYYPVVDFVAAAGGDLMLVTPYTVRSRVTPKLTRTYRQLPLCLAWAITIHKAQGATIDALRICMPSTFACGQAYVAVSRGTAFDKITLDVPVPMTAFTAYKPAVELYDKLGRGETVRPDEHDFGIAKALTRGMGIRLTRPVSDEAASAKEGAILAV